VTAEVSQASSPQDVDARSSATSAARARSAPAAGRPS
jgi:hypothetical protein